MGGKRLDFISGVDNYMNTMLYFDLNFKVFALHGHVILRSPRNMEIIQIIMEIQAMMTLRLINVDLNICIKQN